MSRTTSPYLSGPDILEHPTRTVKEVHLDFSSAEDGCIKAGSPISATGKVANDATAIGVLLHDCYSDCGCGHGLVVVAGRIDAAVAEEHTGIAISDEAKGGMPAVVFVGADGCATGGGPGGVTSWKDLTDKPFDSEYQRVTLVDSVTVEIPDNGFGATVDTKSVTDFPKLVAGQTYTVIFDDVEYLCTAEVLSQTEASVRYGLGDAVMYNSQYKESYAIPFLVVCKDYSEYGYYTNQVYATPGIHTITIIGDEEVVTKPLDKKYLDDGVATEKWVSEQLAADGYIKCVVFDLDLAADTISTRGLTDAYQHYGLSFAVLRLSTVDLYPTRKYMDSTGNVIHFYFTGGDGTEYEVQMNIIDGSVTYTVTPATEE